MDPSGRVLRRVTGTLHLFGLLTLEGTTIPKLTAKTTPRRNVDGTKWTRNLSFGASPKQVILNGNIYEKATDGNLVLKPQNSARKVAT